MIYHVFGTLDCKWTKKARKAAKGHHITCFTDVSRETGWQEYETLTNQCGVDRQEAFPQVFEITQQGTRYIGNYDYYVEYLNKEK